MRRALDTLYAVSGGLAALCMIGVLACVVIAIVSRQLDVYVAGMDAYAGYFMAAAGFLALASTLKHGEHIRVTLLLNSLSKPGKRRMDIFALLVGCVLAASLAWFSVKLVHDSWLYNDISTGNDATPLWIPQISMAVGAVLFLVALVDEAIARIRGIEPVQAHEDQRHE
jgi:TRAP-type C4-dicarboxylate transport system, small permease component